APDCCPTRDRPGREKNGQQRDDLPQAQAQRGARGGKRALLGPGKWLCTSPRIPQRLGVSAQARILSPQRRVNELPPPLVGDRLRDALGVVVARCAAVASLLSVPGHGAPAPTEDRCSVANPHVNRYTQHRSEPP